MLIKIKDSNYDLEPKSPEQFSEEQKAHFAKFKIPDQDSLTNVAERMGTPMRDTDLIGKIRAMTGYTVWVEDSKANPGGANFYRMKGNEVECLKAPFQRGILPQYSILHVNELDLPDPDHPKTPGWMEVVARLIVRRVISYRDAIKVFKIHDESSHNARLWRQTIQNFR